MTVRVRVERAAVSGTCTPCQPFMAQNGAPWASPTRVLPGTRGRVGAQRVQRLVWTPVHALGAAARVTHLSAST